VTVQVKICGLNSPEAVRAAATADFGGFVFFPRSPRNVRPEEAAALAAELPRRVRRVALVVDADDATLRQIVVQFRPDFVQLHGSETPERVAAIKRDFGLKAIKAITVSKAADLDTADAYLDIVDMLLFDAHPPARPDALPGGNATPFDWRLLQGRSWPIPWLLSGGLTPANVAEAAAVSGAPAVDVSSGVEDRPGHKDPKRIKAFLQAARG
jgi:phosphoribosylanthranilate isomerase